MESAQARVMSRESDLDVLFYPASFAHVGASARDQMGRYGFTGYLQNMNFKGNLYPVNPRYEEVLGLKCYPSLAAIGKEVDLAVLSLPAPACADVLEEVPEGQVKFVVIHTSGFGEINKEELDQRIRDLSRQKGFRIIGPNCMGVYSQQGRVAFWQDQHELPESPGSVGFISQSGGIAINMVSASKGIGVNFNKVISLGNQTDVSINEVLEYMSHDASVQVIALYVEDVKDGNRFLDLIRDTTPHKPVLIWKGGLTEVGKATARSHTGSMAGDEKIFLAAMRQAGAIMVDNFQQMLRAIRLLQPPLPLPGEKIGIISGGGGMSVNIGDLFSVQPYVSVPLFARETREKLQDLLPEHNVYINNPVDPGSTGFPSMGKIIQAIGEDPYIESILLAVEINYLSEFYNFDAQSTAVDEISDLMLRFSAKIGKPIFVNIMQLPDNREDYYHARGLLIDKFNQKKIPWVDGSFKEIAETINGLSGYSRHLRRLRGRQV